MHINLHNVFILTPNDHEEKKSQDFFHFFLKKKRIKSVSKFPSSLLVVCTEGFFVAGLNLTADRCFIASNPHLSLRTLTMDQWECVRRWVEDQKPGADPTSLNIIAGDFIGSIPLCSIIIALNKTQRPLKLDV